MESSLLPADFGLPKHGVRRAERGYPDQSNETGYGAHRDSGNVKRKVGGTERSECDVTMGLSTSNRVVLVVHRAEVSTQVN